MTFEQFQATRTTMDAQTLADAMGVDVEFIGSDYAHTYDGTLYIEILPRGMYGLLLICDYIESADLTKLERMLHDFGTSEGFWA